MQFPQMMKECFVLEYLLSESSACINTIITAVTNNLVSPLSIV